MQKSITAYRCQGRVFTFKLAPFVNRQGRERYRSVSPSNVENTAQVLSGQLKIVHEKNQPGKVHDGVSREPLLKGETVLLTSSLR